MQLKPKKNIESVAHRKLIDEIGKTDPQYLTEEELAQVLGLPVKKAIIKALEMRFSRIPVKNTHYYAKRQVLAYLNGQTKKT